MIRSPTHGAKLWLERRLREGDAGLRIHVGDSGNVIPLLEYFDGQTDCVALQVGESEIEVTLLGSYAREAHDAAVKRRMAQFRLQHRHLRGLDPHAGNSAPAV